MATKRRILRNARVADNGRIASSPPPVEDRGELILVARPEVGLNALGTEVESFAGIDVSALASLISSEGIAIYPVIDSNQTASRARSSRISPAESPDLSVYYQIDAPEDRLEEIAERLRKVETIVDAAYIKPPADLPFALTAISGAGERVPFAPYDFTAKQEYLSEAPGGIDARFAWSVCGGKGNGVKIIDIECGWRLSHKDLKRKRKRVVGGAPSAEPSHIDHGTAVMGVIGGDHNSFGINGICPDAKIAAISVLPRAGGWGSAAAIWTAANKLNPGDIILIELHRAGPRFSFEQPRGQEGLIPVEWWPCDMVAIMYAVNRGIIVVEAGGNGSENLDDSIYNKNPSDPNRRFPSWWQNPFKRNPIDSGAIIVGAGAPPPNTHSHNYGPDRSRLEYSNYGPMFDAQAWGEEVTTTGYGDLTRTEENRDLWYTDRFARTSSASAIIAGALGSIQGVLRKAGEPLLTPATARTLLRSTGSPQQNGPSGSTAQRIGNRPNLREMIGALIPVTF